MTALPMFPLGHVLLPHVAIPLHVFEPRYRAMMRDCLAADGRFGVVLIERGSEVGGGDTRFATGTMATVSQSVELPDGRWLLEAFGLRRIRVIRWLADDPYPRAEVEDAWEGPAGTDLHARRTEVERRFRRLLALQAEAGETVAAATAELDEDPVVATYEMAALAGLGPLDAQRLLEQPGPDERLMVLGECLAAALEVAEHHLR